MQRISWLIPMIALNSVWQAGADEVPVAHDEVTVAKDLPYLDSQREEKLDLYSPSALVEGKRYPGILIIHGGGWVSGDKGQDREQKIGRYLAAQGYICASINYKLSPQQPDGTRTPSWPTNLYDCKQAVRYLRKNADRFQIDPEHLGVIGGSAGGHLALLVGLTSPESGLDPPGEDEHIDCRVQAVVVLYGWSNVEAYGEDMIGGTLEEVPEIFRQAAPTSHASADDPPVFIAHGTADALIPVLHAHQLEKSFKNAGVEFEMKILIGAPHSFQLVSEQADLRPQVIGFFDKHLKPASP